MTVALVTASGLPVTTGGARTVTLRSSSPQGMFSTSVAGPWTSTLALTAAPGTSVAFYYQDTLAGKPTLTASADGVTAATQVVTVTAGPAAAL